MKSNPTEREQLALRHGNSVQVPRWVIAVQVGLLTTLPFTCFLVGFAAARLSQPQGLTDNLPTTCRVSGKIQTAEGNPEPAVIVLLPLEKQLTERLNPISLNPATFQPLNNSVIEAIQRLGGGVTRTSASGAFRIEVDSPGRFMLVATSLAPLATGSKQASLPREITAELSRFFLPVERLFEGYRVQTLQLNATEKQLDLGAIQFGDSR